MASREAREGEEFVAGLLQAVATARHFNRHLRMNALRRSSTSDFILA
jgi:hypothetical protein